MSDIFLNYVRDDADKADKLRDAFRQQGWTVFWLNVYLPHKGADAEIVDKELEGAKVNVTLWSWRAAHRSTAVRKTLEHMSSAPHVLVRLDTRQPSSTFASVRVFDLSDWDGAASHAGLQKLLSHLRELILDSPHKAEPPASLENLSLSEIQENARLGIKESAEARPGGERQFGGVFISYRRADKADARGLYDRLAARFGVEKVFFDLKNIGGGENFVEAITHAAKCCVVMLVLISPRWLRRTDGPGELEDYVCLEVTTAFTHKIRVIPVLIQGATMPAPKELPEVLSPLAYLHALVLSDDARWERDVEDLINRVEGLLNT